MTETPLSHGIQKELRKCGFWVIRLQVKGRSGRRSVATGEPGLPDLYLPGLGHLEVKVPGRSLSPAQIAWHRRAKAAGVRVWTVDSVREAVWVANAWRRS